MAAGLGFAPGCNVVAIRDRPLSLVNPNQVAWFKALEYTDTELKMPPDGQLSADTIARFKEWIAAGAIDPRDTEPTGKPKQVGLAVEKARDHWSYRPIVQPPVPRSIKLSTVRTQSTHS